MHCELIHCIIPIPSNTQSQWTPMKTAIVKLAKTVRGNETNVLYFTIFKYNGLFFVAETVGSTTLAEWNESMSFENATEISF